MSKLYVDASFENVVQIGKKVYEYGTQLGPTDVHTVDAGLELLQNTNVLLQGHEDQVRFETVPVSSKEEAVNKLGELCNKEDDASLKQGFNLALLIQIARIVKYLLGEYITENV